MNAPESCGSCNLDLCAHGFCADCDCRCPVCDEPADVSPPEPECPFHAAGNEGPCRYCEDQ